MKARIRIEATVDISKNDYKTLESAGPVELVQTAQMQGVEISTSVEKTRKSVKEESAVPSETAKEDGNGEGDRENSGI